MTAEQLALVQALADTTHSQAGEALDALLKAYAAQQARVAGFESEADRLTQQALDFARDHAATVLRNDVLEDALRDLLKDDVLPGWMQQRIRGVLTPETKEWRSTSEALDPGLGGPLD